MVYMKKDKLKGINYMNNKSFFISKLIYSILIAVVLIYLCLKTPSNKIIFIPFLICSFAQILKYIFLILEKTKYIQVINKIFVVGFLLFWFGFLVYSIYYSLLKKEYSLLLFSIPFWLVGILILKKLIKDDKSE